MKGPQAPLTTEMQTARGLEARDMVNLLRELGSSEILQREAVYHYFCDTRPSRGQTASSR